jgi:hypothetical protein
MVTEIGSGGCCSDGEEENMVAVSSSETSKQNTINGVENQRRPQFG